MLSLTKEVINNIAQELESGMTCFLHLRTNEIVSYPDEALDEEIWEEEMNKVRKHPKDYLEFTPMDSRESFRVMENFVGQMTDTTIRHRFEEIILRHKPFQQFKNLLLDYPDLRQQWFVYKEEQYQQYVQEQVEAYNRNEEFSGENS